MRLSILVAASLSITAQSVHATTSSVNATQDPIVRGTEIAMEADKRFSGWKDLRADMKMTIQRNENSISKRKIKVQSREVNDDGDHTKILFRSPKDISGTAFLTHSKKTDNDMQWLYLPAIKRVKRISSQNVSSPFVGSDFAFEDMSSQEIEKYTYKYIGETSCGDKLECYIVERYPTNENSGYSKQVTWIDKEEYRTQSIKYYDKNNELKKTLINYDFAFQAGHWRPYRNVMTNHVTGSKTELSWNNFTFETGLDSGDFSKNSLKRSR